MVASGSPVMVNVAQPTTGGLGCRELRQSGAGKVDGEAAVVAEALKVATFPFLLSELAV